MICSVFPHSNSKSLKQLRDCILCQECESRVRHHGNRGGRQVDCGKRQWHLGVCSGCMSQAWDTNGPTKDGCFFVSNFLIHPHTLLPTGHFRVRWKKICAATWPHFDYLMAWSIHIIPIYIYIPIILVTSPCPILLLCSFVCFLICPFR